MDGDLNTSLSINDKDISQEEVKGDKEIAVDRSSQKRKHQDSTDERNSDNDGIALKIPKDEFSDTVKESHGILTQENEYQTTTHEISKELLTSEQKNIKHDQNYEVIITEEISVEELQQRFLTEVERTWKVVNRLTGFKLGVIPPICLDRGKKIGHWIQLNKDVIPFVYVSSTEDTGEIDVSTNSSDDTQAKTSTAALLITEYVNSVLTRLGKETDDPLIHAKEMLNELLTCLHTLKADMDSIIFWRKRNDLLTTMSKIDELAVTVEQLSLIESVVLCEFKDTMVTVTESQLVCSTLGLVPRFTDKMNAIKDDRVLHESPFYIVNDLIDDEETTNDIESCGLSHSNLSAALSLLGFSEEKCEEIAYYISCYPDIRHSIIYWAKQYLERAFNRHPLLTMMSVFERYANKPLNNWFDAEEDLLAASSENIINLRFQMIQIETFENLTSDIIDRKFQQNAYTLLFHGAKQAYSLNSILRKGILLRSGNTYQDFSHGNGFYLSDDFEAAQDWVDKRGHSEKAIIVYRVPNHLLEFGSSGGLDLTDQSYLWYRVVKYHRTGCPDSKDDDLVNISRHSFIKGLVSKNGILIRKGYDCSLKPFVFKERNIQQYCIRSKELAADLSSCVVAVIIKK